MADNSVLSDCSTTVCYSHSEPSNERLNHLRNHLEYLADKDQFKWKGTDEHLVIFTKLVLDTSGQAALSEDSSHNLLTIKIQNIIVKWWRKTQTLVVQGKDHQIFRGKLVDILQLNSIQSSPSPLLTDENGGKSNELGLDLESSVIYNGSLSVTAQHPDEYGNIAGCSRLESKFDQMKQELKKIREITLRVHEAQRHNMLITDNDNRMEETERLRHLVQDQKLENTMLREKIAVLQNERDSLTTVLRILQEESNQVRGQRADLSSTPKFTCSDEPSTSQGKEEARDDAGFQKVEKSKEKKPASQRSSKKAENHRPSTGKMPQPTIIMGDSMIKHLNDQKMSAATKSSVKIKCFPGATVGDMRHYSIPVLSKVTTPTNVILHVGTNDLKSSDPSKVSDSIVDLARHIENSFPKAKVLISELIDRNDKQELSEAVKRVNKNTSKFCNQEGRAFIRHKNISCECLNKSNLHLNNKGVAILASNFRQTILNLN